MSRCGNCPIYDRTEYGVHCPGSFSIEDCADKLQDLYYAMNHELERQREQKFSPLTLEELKEMDGHPVWVVLQIEGVAQLHAYAIVEPESECVKGLKWSLLFDGYGVWLAYRHPPEGGQ